MGSWRRHGWVGFRSICLGQRSRVNRTKLLHAGRSAGSVERATGMRLAGFAILRVVASIGTVVDKEVSTQTHADRQTPGPLDGPYRVPPSKWQIGEAGDAICS